MTTEPTSETEPGAGGKRLMVLLGLAMFVVAAIAGLTLGPGAR